MKKSLKNILIIIAVSYLLLNIIYTVFSIGLTEEGISIISSQKEEVVLNNITFNNIEQSRYYGMLYVLEYNVMLLIISSIIGILIGTMYSLKEDSKVKYILLFVLGNFIYTFVWMIIENIFYKTYGLELDMNFLKYVQTLKNYFLSYVFFYFIIMIARIVTNKYKVKVLNDNLEKKDNLKKSKMVITEKQKKGLRKISIGIGLILIAIIIIVIGRRSIILINYGKKINEISNCNNFSRITEVIYEKDGIVASKDTSITYYKDGEVVIERDGEKVTYGNEEKQEIFNIRTEEKIAYKNSRFTGRIVDIDNFYFGDCGIRIWGNILLSFNVSIKTGESDGIPCYIITKDNTILYVNRENYEPVKEIIITKYYGSDERSVGTEKYKYAYNNVTEEDVKKPDLTGFEIRQENY